MKKSAFIISALILALSFTGARAAKYAGDFMYLGAGGRPLALGGAYAAYGGDVLAGYYNPAGLSFVERSQSVFMHSETFGSLLNHDFLAYTRPIGNENNRAAFAVSLYRLGGGGILVTRVDQTGRFRVIREDNHADYVGYISYGRLFGSSLSAGITAKLIYRDIVDESAIGLGIDIGAIYDLARWAKVGINLQDIPSTLISYTTGMKQRVNPTAKIGFALTGSKGKFEGSLLADMDTRFEGRDYASQISAGPVSFDSHFGVEVVYWEKLSARVGSDVGNLTLGAGLRFDRFTIDIAMRDHSDLDNTFLVSMIMRM
ncbi:MAG: PorV/PorQ family protein [candidate division Zixibacteria bacterium]